MNSAGFRERAQRLLRELAGSEAELRDDQFTAIEALVVQHRRALVVQRTGWGKSAVYFVATALLRERGAGPTVIVSPLLALMRNQIEAANRAGIRAVTLNSANTEEWDEVYERISGGDVDLLLVSPERLNNPEFRDNVLPRLTATIGMLVVDEAHCISDWGHDFRPDYRRLRTLLGTLPTGVPVLATTATANDRVVGDVAEQLGIGLADDTMVLRGPLDRPSLRLAVVRVPTARARLAWLTEHLANLPGSGIIYTLTVAAAHDVASMLAEHGHEVAAYTGQTEPEQRRATEEDLINNRVKALVATSALGMGFDKPDLGFVVHIGAPSTPIAYYQQVGRAGRGVERAEVILLPGEEDTEIWRYFDSLSFPAEHTVNQVLDTLAAAEKPMSVAKLEPKVELSRGRLGMVLKVLDVDGAVRRVREGWESTGQPWTYGTRRYEQLRAAREAEQRAMLDYLDTTGCRMEHLLRQLDDPNAAPCGRCDNCTGRYWTNEVSGDTIAGVSRSMDRPGVELAARKQWPTGMAALDIPVSGRIAAEERPEPGRALGKLTSMGWGPILRELVGRHGRDTPVPDEVFKACLAVLAAWDWDQRPVAVVAVGSGSRPTMIEDLAKRVADAGRLHSLGTVHAPGPPPRRANSAQRLADLWNRFELSEPLRANLAAVDGPVLLVDDQVDTGWSMAVLARMLRTAGSPAVLPFALASAG